MTSNFLLPTIKPLTKINTSNDTLIDNIFTNQFNPDITSGNHTHRFDKENFLLDVLGLDWCQIIQIDKQDANLSFGALLNKYENNY